MSEQLVLSVVDQSPVRDGGTGGEALQATIELAVATEALGYERFWVAEHHNLGNFAGTSPEIMIGQIAARTSRIRVGSGGVMLPHYSSFKVAELFGMLESLFPGRIDLGIGRAPGSDQMTAAALSHPRQPIDIRLFPQQVQDMLSYLNGDMDGEHPFASLHAAPDRVSAPDVWLLGSRYDSAAMAAEMGLAFSYAHFFGLAVEQGPAIVEMYRLKFKPSKYLQEPKVNVGVHVLCAETEEEALRLGHSRNLSRVRSVQGIRAGIPTVEDAMRYQYRPDEFVFLQQLKQNYVDGDPQQVKEGLERVAEAYQTNDLAIVTICYDYADRLRSYELVADVCGLNRE